jgi:hypothetical protein
MGTEAVGVTGLLLTGGMDGGPREQKGGGGEVQICVLVQVVFHSFIVTLMIFVRWGFHFLIHASTR